MSFDIVLPSHCCLPCCLVSALGRHSSSLQVHFLLLIRTLCPAHLHFRSAITSMTSLNLVLDLIQVFLFRLRKEILSIAFHFRCYRHNAEFLTDFSVMVMLSAPYTNTGRTHCSKSFHFKVIDILLLSTLALAPKAGHARVMRL